MTARRTPLYGWLTAEAVSLTGTRVWTVPGQAHRPLTAARPEPRRLARGEHTRLCAFCPDRYLETTPEKARLVGPDFVEHRHVPASRLFDSVAEFRRFANLFEIVSAENVSAIRSGGCQSSRYSTEAGSPTSGQIRNGTSGACRAKAAAHCPARSALAL